MAWPPSDYPLRADFNDATPTFSIHPASHNSLGRAINDLVIQIQGTDEEYLYSVPDVITGGNIQWYLENWGNNAGTSAQPTGSNVFTIACIGDSLTQGFAVTIGTDDWATLLRGTLQQEFGYAGYGFLPALNTASNPNFWTYGPGVVTDSGTGAFGIGGTSATLTSGQTATLTVGTSCDAIDIYYVDNSTNTSILYYVDGATPSTGAMTIAGLNSNTTKKATISLGAPGPHTLTFFGPASGSFVLLGANLKYGLTGAVLHNLGMAGTKTSDWTTIATRFDIVSMLAPDLVIVNLGANEATSQVSLASYDSNLQILINKCKAFTKVPKILLWASPQRQTDSSPIRQSQYNDQMGTTAQTTSSGFLDIRQAWGTNFDQQRMENNGAAIHPNSLGHADIAARMYRTLISSRWGSRSFKQGQFNVRDYRGSVSNGHPRISGTTVRPDFCIPTTGQVANNRLYYVPLRFAAPAQGLAGGPQVNITSPGVAFPAVNVTFKSISSNIATLITSTPHGLAVGNTVIVSSVDATFNGSYIVTAVTSPTSVSYSKTASNVTVTAASGTVQGRPEIRFGLYRDTIDVPGLPGKIVFQSNPVDISSAGVAIGAVPVYTFFNIVPGLVWAAVGVSGCATPPTMTIAQGAHPSVNMQAATPNWTTSAYGYAWSQYTGATLPTLAPMPDLTVDVPYVMILFV